MRTATNSKQTRFFPYSIRVFGHSRTPANKCKITVFSCWGSRGREFKSRHSDQKKPPKGGFFNEVAPVGANEGMKTLCE